jgi:outer membrane lipoprotein-sorting protein
VIDARSHSHRANGNITLVFSEPSLELKQWTVVDAQGLLTTVSVRDLRQDVALDPSLFVIAQKNTVTKKDE